MRQLSIAKIGLLLVLFRLAGLAERYLVQPDASWRERLQLFVPAALSHAGTLWVIVGLFLLATALAPAWRRTIAIAAAATFSLLMIAGQADFIVSAVTGAPLTPTVFRTYRGIQVVRSNEFLEPLRAHAGATLFGGSAFAGVLAWMAVLIGRDRRRAAPTRPWRTIVGSIAGGTALSVVPALVPWPTAPVPIEMAFAREWAGLDRARLDRPEREAIADLRMAVGLPPGEQWLSDRYPLVHGPRRPQALTPVSDLPDIVVIMVESLRAEDLGFVTGSNDSVTGNLDQLAARSVVFPNYISNGFPTAPSVLAFHCSAWPHRRKEIITDFADRHFDSVPGRLKGLGYDTRYVGADPRFDNQTEWFSRWYATAVDLVEAGQVPTDRNIIGRAIEEVRRHDEAGTAGPLFAFVSTYSTHYPFRLPDDAGEAPQPAAAGLRAQYRQTLRYADRQVGRLLAYLDGRRRRDRTVTIVLGDHGFYVDLRRTSGVPENDNEWTAALVTGPEALVGPPRRIGGPASHVDMLPTILALVGDHRPSAALGRDLLHDAPGGAREAFSIRPGGLRLDRGGYSALLDWRTPTHVVTRVSFPGLFEPVGPMADADREPLRLIGRATTWSFLVESDRVWSDAFLKTP